LFIYTPFTPLIMEGNSVNTNRIFWKIRFTFSAR
jgi:hypothetical protein